MFSKILNTFGTKFLAAIINLLIAIIISQVLGTIGKGQQGLIIASIAYILVFSNLIGGAAIVYLIPKYTHSLILIPAYIWSIIIGGLSFIILKITNLLGDPFILAVCILSLVNAFTGINSNILIGKEKIKSANLISLVQPVFITISLLLSFFVLEDRSINAYLTALYFSFGMSFMLSVFLIIKHIGNFKLHPFQHYLAITKQLLRYGILNQLAQIFQLLSFRMSYYWLNDLYSESEVGVYSNGIALIESVWLISRSICMVQYARIVNMSDIKLIQKLSLNLSKVGLIFSLILIIPLTLLPASFYEFIFGAGFGDVSLVIRSLAPGVLLFNITLILDHYFSGIGKFHINTIASFVGLLASLILFSIFIPSFGIVGAGWASSISYTITSIIIFVFFYRDSGFGLKSLAISKSELVLFFSEYKSSLLNREGK